MSTHPPFLIFLLTSLEDGSLYIKAIYKSVTLLRGSYKNGLKFLDKTLRFLLELGKEESDADLLTGFFIFTGLVSKDKATLLGKKIMSVTTESSAYGLIIKQGIEKGKIENARAMLGKDYPFTDIIEIIGLTEEQLKDASLNGRK